MKIRTGLAVMGVCALAAPTAFAAPAKDSDSNEAPRDCSQNLLVSDAKFGETDWVGPNYIWPPNHKPRDIAITATPAFDADALEQMDVRLTTIGTHNQYVVEYVEEAKGSGNTDPATDVSPQSVTTVALDGETATNEHAVRGERAGTIKSGRTYSFTTIADFGADGDGDASTTEDFTPAFTCTETYTATVPHDQGSSTKKRRALKLRRR